jgi:hypothetical protein
MQKRSMAAASAGLGLVVAVSLVLLSTCQKSGGGEDGGGGHSEDATALSGTWSTGCQPDPAKAGYFFVDTRTFDGTTFSTSFESYGDEGCTAGLMSQTQTGAFAIGLPMDGTDATELDITIGAISITLHTDELVQSYNAKKFCGGGWEKETQRTITRADCGGGESTEPDMVYEIFEARDGALYFGKKDAAHTGKSESQRPETIDESRPFAKS